MIVFLIVFAEVRAYKSFQSTHIIATHISSNFVAYKNLDVTNYAITNVANISSRPLLRILRVVKA